MLSKQEIELAKNALKVQLALDNGNPKPLLKLIDKNRNCALKYLKESRYQEIFVAINDLVLFSPDTVFRQKRRQSIDAALKGNHPQALVECEYMDDALDLIVRVGILQFDIILDNIYIPMNAPRFEGWSALLKSSRNGATPGIYSDQPIPSVGKSYELKKKVQTIKESGMELER